MLRSMKNYLPLVLGLIAPLSASATSYYCIASSNGFGNGGTSYIGTNFTVPGEAACAAWNGFTKTAATVILTTHGTACLSNDGKVMTLSLLSGDPAFVGANNVAIDYLRLTRSSNSGSFTGGTDNGEFGGSAKTQTCTTTLKSLPDNHD